MATDAIVVTNTGLVKIETMAMTPIVQFAPMQPGRNYLVWATGTLHIQSALVDVELEAFDAMHKIQLAGRGICSYSLAVGTTLPADDDLFTVAKVSAAIRDFGSPGQPADVSTVDGQLVLLAVDSVTVQEV
jgi:hypothetical protein